MKTIDPLSGLAAFLAVADHLNFSKAATELGMSRATVSAQVHDLESRLGTRLFQRSTRNVVLTEQGAAYKTALSGVLKQVKEAERAAISLQHDNVGRLRIAAPPDLAPNFIAAIIADFLQANPAISIEMTLGHDAVNLVEQGFDLAIRGAFSVEPNVIMRRIGVSPIHICASPAYLDRHGTPSHPDELADHSCLHFSPIRWGRVWAFQKNQMDVRVPLVPRFEINDGNSLRVAALGGAGITLLPGFVVGRDIAEGRLVSILRDWPVPSVPINAIYPANRHIARKVRNFVAFVSQRLGGDPDFQERPDAAEQP